MSKALYWFTDDLRLQDNLALNSTLYASSSIMFIYVMDESLFSATNFDHVHLGEKRLKFIQQSLIDLSDQLQQLGYELYVLKGHSREVINHVITQMGIEVVGSHLGCGYDERTAFEHIKSDNGKVRFIHQHNNLLFGPQQLEDKDLSGSFSKFRKKADKLLVSSCVEDTFSETLPLPFVMDSTVTDKYMFKVDGSTASNENLIQGGEKAALDYLEEYFSTQSASSYKMTRNALDGKYNSTQFSPYLSVGNISPRQIINRLDMYEQQHGANDSTYWIRFELMWRDFFHHKAIKKGSSLFKFAGEKGARPLTTYYPQRFKRWCNGTTQFPLVNACMRELNETGFMSNRGRQIVASCLVNELQVDWRYGAAYFQQQLIDYDVASNWGNWQYIAGVGDDPRGGRHFNIEKQAQMYDPDGTFQEKWSSRSCLFSEDVDMVDWPVMSAKHGH
ncbi:DASH family cryptochrome [Pseudoalteromonas luteoviolacea]|uniref:DASH family cryptochrome n=1 Tax=Pseudoalteromonas luteoviolacea TaxID=43657 RepID=UPI001EEEEB2F|nr:DASH family cryptochrome [Pseudoalteromonas luteoviolacea]MCF6439446.1 DASH family cryptochrome [Pseudoalteromonas luteoviolacea]